MKIASWNVNSVRVRIEHIKHWLSQHSPDLLCLQETKVEDEQFPLSELEDQNYSCVFEGQKSYNGVAIIYKKGEDCGLIKAPIFPDEQKRLIGITFLGIDVINVYVPNGNSVGSDKYSYKLSWLEILHDWLERRLEENANLIVVGDFNIAPTDLDVYDPEVWRGKILCSDSERKAFRGLLGLGLVDAFRKLEGLNQTFTWWDYRLNAFKRDMGMRIDHILVSSDLENKLQKVFIDRVPRGLDRPSDHAPICVEI